MEMTVTGGKDGEVQFQSGFLQNKERAPQKILDRNAGRTDDLIRICGWCKSIDTGSEEWKYPDEAISMLNLFNQYKLPRLTHSICESCYLELSDKLALKKTS